MTLARLKSVAGVRIPDTALCIAAVDLLESSSPKFLCTHCLRTYIFGILAVRSLGRPVADVETAFGGPPGGHRPAQPRRTSLDLDRRCCAHRRLHVAWQGNSDGIANHVGGAV